MPGRPRRPACGTYSTANEGVDTVRTFAFEADRISVGPARIPHAPESSQRWQGPEDSSSPTSGTAFRGCSRLEGRP